jgi:hypothetical protein
VRRDNEARIVRLNQVQNLASSRHVGTARRRTQRECVAALQRHALHQVQRVRQRVLGRRAVKDRVAERRHDQTARFAFGFETKVRFDPGVWRV